MNKHYLWISCKCLDYYKFLNKLAKLNLPILRIKYQDKKVYLKVDEATYKKLNKYLLSYKFIIIKDLGIYNIKNKLIKYKEFILAFFVGIIILWGCSNLIVKVNILHENKEIREILREELIEAGIKTLSFKKSYAELQKIKNNILEKYPDKIDWLEFDMWGMILNVKVEERIITNTNKEDIKCNIVATKEGTITNLKVSSGDVKVNPNDLVKKGDILISGIITHNETEKKRVCAEGEVYANTWYTVKVSIPFNYELRTKTGKKKYNLVWENAGNKKRLLKERFTSFQSDYKTLLAFLDYKLLLETEYENEVKLTTLTEEEALNMGIEKAVLNLEKQLQEKDTIIDKKVLKKVVNNSKMEIEIFIIVNELISKSEIIVEGTDSSDNGYNQNNNQ